MSASTAVIVVEGLVVVEVIEVDDPTVVIGMEVVLDALLVLVPPHAVRAKPMDAPRTPTLTVNDLMWQPHYSQVILNMPPLTGRSGQIGNGAGRQ